MSIFEQVFGTQGVINSMNYVNGMHNIHERDGVLSFAITPTHKADSVVLELNDNTTFNITFYKHDNPCQYFQQVEECGVLDVLEQGLGVLF